jgi:hypothetical protein
VARGRRRAERADDRADRDRSLPAVGTLLFVALISGLFGFAAWTTLLKRHTAAAVTPFALLVPVFGMASAALLLGERPSALELGGAVLICAGVDGCDGHRRRNRLTEQPSCSISPSDVGRAHLLHPRACSAGHVVILL